MLAPGSLSFKDGRMHALSMCGWPGSASCSAQSRWLQIVVLGQRQAVTPAVTEQLCCCPWQMHMAPAPPANLPATDLRSPAGWPNQVQVAQPKATSSRHGSQGTVGGSQGLTICKQQSAQELAVASRPVAAQGEQLERYTKALEIGSSGQCPVPHASNASEASPATINMHHASNCRAPAANAELCSNRLVAGATQRSAVAPLLQHNTMPYSKNTSQPAESAMSGLPLLHKHTAPSPLPPPPPTTKPPSATHGLQSLLTQPMRAAMACQTDSGLRHKLQAALQLHNVFSHIVTRHSHAAEARPQARVPRSALGGCAQAVLSHELLGRLHAALQAMEHAGVVLPAQPPASWALRAAAPSGPAVSSMHGIRPWPAPPPRPPPPPPLPGPSAPPTCPPPPPPTAQITPGDPSLQVKLGLLLQLHRVYAGIARSGRNLREVQRQMAGAEHRGAAVVKLDEPWTPNIPMLQTRLGQAILAVNHSSMLLQTLLPNQSQCLDSGVLHCSSGSNVTGGAAKKPGHAVHQSSVCSTSLPQWRPNVNATAFEVSPGSPV